MYTHNEFKINNLQQETPSLDSLHDLFIKSIYGYSDYHLSLDAHTITTQADQSSESSIEDSSPHLLHEANLSQMDGSKPRRKSQKRNIRAADNEFEQTFPSSSFRGYTEKVDSFDDLALDYDEPFFFEIDDEGSSDSHADSTILSDNQTNELSSNSCDSTSSSLPRVGSMEWYDVLSYYSHGSGILFRSLSTSSLQAY
jgi:hypothetical protein